MSTRYGPGAALVTLLLAGIVACGGSANAPSSTNASSQRARTLAAAHTLVQCLRQHGYPNVPDPVLDDAGNVSWPAGTDPADIPTADQAPAACQQAANSLQQAMGSQSSQSSCVASDGGACQGPSAEDRRLGLQLARCMRQHGLPDWPDPNPDGTWSLPSRLRQSKAAWAATLRQHCAQYLPSGKLVTQENGNA